MREIREADTRAMQRLMDTWNRQLKAHAEVLEDHWHDHQFWEDRAEDRAALKDELTEDRIEERRSADTAAASSVESYVRGLIDQAAAGYNVSASLPSGVRIAGLVAGGTSSAEIGSLIESARTADDAIVSNAEYSARWALEHGYMPHPGDLSAILKKTGRDSTWNKGLDDLAQKLKPFETGYSLGPVELRARRAGERLGLLGAERRLLTLYGSQRVLQLILQPSSLNGDHPEVFPGVSGLTRMGYASLDAVLDQLFK